MDILDGLSYLHSRHLIHGRLNSSNCLVDQRLTIKLTGKVSLPPPLVHVGPNVIAIDLDYGLDDLRLRSINTQSYIPSVEAYRRVYYAPELISIHELKLTPPIDIYAFGIILNEIATRSEPYGVSGMPKEDRQTMETSFVERRHRSCHASGLSSEDRANDS